MAFIAQDLPLFHWSCSLRNAQHEAAADKTIVSCCGTFELFSQVCLVCQRTARLRKQIRVHTLRRTHPADTKMPFCLMSNRGVAAPNPALSFFLFFFFSLPSLCYSRLGDYDRLATPCIKKPSIGLSKFLCTVSRGAIGSLSSFLVSGNQSMCISIRLACIM